MALPELQFLGPVSNNLPHNKTLGRLRYESNIFRWLIHLLGICLYGIFNAYIPKKYILSFFISYGLSNNFIYIL